VALQCFSSSCPVQWDTNAGSKTIGSLRDSLRNPRTTDVSVARQRGSCLVAPATLVPDTSIIATTEVVNGVPTGDVTLNLVGAFFDMTSTTWAQLMSDNTDLEAFVLLHELAHLTGKLGDDTTTDGAAAAAQFNKQSLTNCFGLKLQ